MSTTADQAKAVIRNYEYQVRDTPRFTVIDETWELVDIYPKPRSFGVVYIMVFRKELDPSSESQYPESDLDSFQKRFERGEIQS